jgi:hypothetical protein
LSQGTIPGYGVRGQLVGTFTIERFGDIDDIWASGTRTLTAATNITSDGGTITTNSGVVSADAVSFSGSTAAADNAEIVFSTDFASNYNATADRWKVDVTHYSGTLMPSSPAGVIPVDVLYWNNTEVPAEHTAGYPIVTIKDGTGTGEIDTTSGVISSRLTTAGLADFFTANSGSTYAASVAGSVVKETADNASGGGGGTDWTADQRTAISAILGIPASGSTPEDPTAGVFFEAQSLEEALEALGLTEDHFTPSSPTWVDDFHTWKFDNRNQTTSPIIVAENLGFDALVAFEPSLSSRVAVQAVSSVTITGSGTAPTLGSATVQTNKRRINIPVDATAATAGTYTITVTFTTTDSQTIVRKGRITLN